MNLALTRRCLTGILDKDWKTWTNGSATQATIWQTDLSHMHCQAGVRATPPHCINIVTMLGSISNFIPRHLIRSAQF